MGTNYYIHGSQEHVAKSSWQGRGFRVIWAQDPDVLDRRALHDPELRFEDEYGNVFSYADFKRLVTCAQEHDTSLVGKEFF